MERLFLLTIMRKFEHRISLRETTDGVLVNVGYVGGRFKSLCTSNDVEFEYVGGSTYKIFA